MYAKCIKLYSFRIQYTSRIPLHTTEILIWLSPRHIQSWCDSPTRFDFNCTSVEPSDVRIETISHRQVIEIVF